MAVKKKEDAPSTEEKKDGIFGGDAQENSTQEVSLENSEKETQEESIPMSKVNELLNKQESKFNAMLEAALDKFRVKTKVEAGKSEMSKDADYVKGLEDDWLEVPAVFFAFSFEFSIHGDKKRGVTTKPPHGKIKFTPIIRSKRRGRRGEEVISVSSIKVHSRVEAEYLRGHSQFGILFFENMEDVLTMDTGWANRLVEANQSIQNLSDQQVIARAKQSGVSVTQDITSMRRELVEKSALEAIKKTDFALYNKIKQGNIDKDTGRVTVDKVINQ